MPKSRAKTDYLLTDSELKRLPCVVWGQKGRPMESVHMVSRAQAESIGLAKYEDGMEGEGARLLAALP